MSLHTCPSSLFSWCGSVIDGVSWLVFVCIVASLFRGSLVVEEWHHCSGFASSVVLSPEVVSLLGGASA